MVKIKISRDFFNTIHAFQHENVGHKKICPTTRLDAELLEVWEIGSDLEAVVLFDALMR